MTLAEMRTALQALGYETDTASQQTAMLNMVYRELRGERRWWWLEGLASVNTVASNGTLSTAGVADFLFPSALEIADGTDYMLMDYLDHEELRERVHTDRTPSTPRYWTWYTNAILLEYDKTVTDLSADGNSPAFPSEYHDILVWGAAKYMAYRERDTTSFK